MTYVDKNGYVQVGKIALHIAGFLSALLALGLWGCPQYNVWEQTLAGEAEFKRAEQNRKIAVQEAQAKLESAKLYAGAEIERARGVAEANKIIATGLKGNEEYLRYLWIVEKAGANVQREVIYVPTEAQMPILEAQRLAK
jgi:regulator of protease activity HflC (stomatin/prohibitin superfamily)